VQRERVQLDPQRLRNPRFIGSAVDALIDLKVRRRLCCQVPVRLDVRPAAC
jgi:hypothetical protein